jgi:hypothetical protein
MRSLLTISLSLMAHAAVAGALVWHASHKTPDPQPPPDPAPQNAGETFELPAPETPEDAPLAQASPSSDDIAAPSPPDAPENAARPTPPQRGRVANKAAASGRPSGGHDPGTTDGAQGGTTTSTLYGAVGDRSASDLATSFLRNFSITESADPAWTSQPLGAAGDATVTFTLDESGHIENVSVSGAPSAALTSGIKRTMALIKGRPFTAKTKVTKLHLSAVVVADSTGAFGVGPGGSEDKKEGTSWFRTGGRRVDLHVRVK